MAYMLELTHIKNMTSPLSFPPLNDIFICHNFLGICGISLSIPFWSNSFTGKSSLQWVFDLVQVPWLPIHHQYRILYETPFRWPAVTLSLGDLVTMVPQDSSLHMLQHAIDCSKELLFGSGHSASLDPK